MRGSGDIGAMVGTAWGIKQLDRSKNRIIVSNIKARDFEPSPPFQLEGRPFIENEGRFQMIAKPGESGTLREVQPKPGRPKSNARQQRIGRVQELLRNGMTCDQISVQLRADGYSVSRETVKKDMQEARKSSSTAKSLKF